jgi:hypothetical protein
VSLLAVFSLLVVALQLTAKADSRGRKYQPPPPTSAITVTVLRSTNGKPIPDASVIFHPIKNGKDSGALELKTNDDGLVKIDIIPIGDTVRLQVIADGWQTYGQDYDIKTDKKDIKVKMKRPGSQYTIYDDDANPVPPPTTTTPKGQSTSAKPSPQTPLPQ